MERPAISQAVLNQLTEMINGDASVEDMARLLTNEYNWSSEQAFTFLANLLQKLNS